MNAINRIELAIRRAASQMPDDVLMKHAFILLADEIEDITHEPSMTVSDNQTQEKALEDYREEQKWP